EKPQALANFFQNRPRNLRIETRLPVAANGNRLEERQRLGHRILDDLADASVVHRDRQRLRLETPPVASITRNFNHEFLKFQSHRIGIGLLIASLDVSEDALPLDSFGILLTRSRTVILMPPSA